MNFNNSAPIFMQIITVIKKQILAGTLMPGAKIKSVRDLALEMGVNPNTVQRALVQLEAEGLILTERTNGKFVTEDKKVISKMRNALIDSEVDSFVGIMQDLGVSSKDLARIISEKYKEEQ